MHRAMALLCLLPALLELRPEPAGSRLCLAPRAPLALIAPVPLPALPARVCLPAHWPRPPAWLG